MSSLQEEIGIPVRLHCHGTTWKMHSIRIQSAAKLLDVIKLVAAGASLSYVFLFGAHEYTWERVYY